MVYDSGLHLLYFAGMLFWSFQNYVLVAGFLLFVPFLILPAPLAAILHQCGILKKEKIAEVTATVTPAADGPSSEDSKNAQEADGKTRGGAESEAVIPPRVFWNAMKYGFTFQVHHVLMPGVIYLLCFLKLEMDGWVPSRIYLASATTSVEVIKLLIYLALAELFLFDWLFHPYAGYFLSVHGSRKPPGAQCQPTMSTYSLFASLSSANLNFHVEHHVSVSQKCETMYAWQS